MGTYNFIQSSLTKSQGLNESQWGKAYAPYGNTVSHMATDKNL